MSQAPSIYERQRNFTSDATNNPQITVPQISSGLDAEFVAVRDSLNVTINRLGEIQRDDGALRDAVVSAQSLSPTVLALLGLNGVVARGAWAASTAYAQGEVVSYVGGTYLCAAAHTSTSSFINDQAAGSWLTIEAPYNNSVSVQRFTSNGVQTVYGLGTSGVINVTNVFVSGVYQNKDTYSINTGTNTLTFSEAPPSGAVIEIVVGVTSIAVVPDQSVTTASIADGAVTSAKIADGTIVTADIADGAITSAKIAASAVVTDRIADSNVTTAKIADANVTTAKIADNAITTAKIAAGAVGTTDLADSAVTTVKIADANVTSAKIADANVITAKIADANVTTAKIADANVTTAKIADGAVTTAKVVSPGLDESAINWSAITNWAPSTAYVKGALVSNNGLSYRRLSAGTSGATFDPAMWIQVTPPIPDGSIATVKIADGAITTAKIATGAVITADLADGAVTAVKLGSNEQKQIAKAWANFTDTAGTFAGGPSTVSRSSGSTTCTVTCTSPHGMITGNVVYATSTPLGTNLFTITVTGANTFTFTSGGTSLIVAALITFSVATIRSSFGISNIAKTTTGNYYINFSSPLADANYCPIVTSAKSSLTNSGDSISNLTTASFLLTHFETGANAAATTATVAVFGN